MRVFNRLFVFALGVALAALGFVVAVEAVWTGLGYRFLWFPGPQWLATLRSTAWSTRAVEVGAAAAALLGLILVVLEMRPWRKHLVPGRSGGGVTWLSTRRSTEQLLGRRIERQVPTSPIRARLRIGALRWKLTLRARAAESSRPVLESAAKAELDRLGAPSGSKVLVRTTGAKGVR